MKRNVSIARSLRSLISSSFCLSSTVTLRLDETKLIRKEELSMFFIAKAASEGILGLLFIICKDFSLIESIITLNSSFSKAGFASGTSFIVAVI